MMGLFEHCRDLLVPQDVRARKGAFFTPPYAVQIPIEIKTQLFKSINVFLLTEDATCGYVSRNLSITQTHSIRKINLQLQNII
jgi:hypothetical protein